MSIGFGSPAAKVADPSRNLPVYAKQQEFAPLPSRSDGER
jgi:hypothetical protein